MIAILMLLMNGAHAGNVTCEVVGGFLKQSVVCGNRQVELYLKPQETVVGLKLSLFDSKHGIERELDVKNVSIKAADVASGNYLKNKLVQKEVKKIEKEWGSEAKLELRSLELGKTAHFFAAQNFKDEVKPVINSEKRSLASASVSEAQHTGIMRAKTKDHRK